MDEQWDQVGFGKNLRYNGHQIRWVVKIYCELPPRIEQQIDRETESQNLEEQYEALNDTNKSKLIAELKAINSVEAKAIFKI
jgi:hypothetical protein